MSSSSTVFFVIAAIALLLGAALLVVDRRGRAGGATTGRKRWGRGPGRDRKRWAEMRGWEYLDSDPVLPSRWRYGPVRYGGPGVARNLISGDVPTPHGSRHGYVFDHEQGGTSSSVLVAVQVQGHLPGAVELWLPDAKMPPGMMSGDESLDLLEERVGDRHAFVSDAGAVWPLLTPRLAGATDAVGSDVDLVWFEDSWVLATAPLDAPPERLQDLLADLAEVGTSLEQGQGANPSLGH